MWLANSRRVAARRRFASCRARDREAIRTVQRNVERACVRAAL
jgi:hypothetical protein